MARNIGADPRSSGDDVSNVTTVTRTSARMWLTWLAALGLACPACSGEAAAVASRRAPASKPPARATALVPPPPAASAGASAPSAEPAVRPVAAPHHLGRADLDPDNDDTVAPPDAVPDCDTRLADLGVTFRRSDLPLTQKRRDVFTCGAHDAVLYLSGPSRTRFRPRPIVTCQMALALARFEVVLGEVAAEHLGAEVRSIEQMGTYACRKMSAYPTMVSEHSYANAIDLRAFILADGRRITVHRHFQPSESPAAPPPARFLGELARRLYDEDVFSVVLTPHFDAHHRDHFHLDLARYRVDGSRAR